MPFSKTACLKDTRELSCGGTLLQELFYAAPNGQSDGHRFLRCTSFRDTGDPAFVIVGQPEIDAAQALAIMRANRDKVVTAELPSDLLAQLDAPAEHWLDAEAAGASLAATSTERTLTNPVAGDAVVADPSDADRNPGEAY